MPRRCRSRRRRARLQPRSPCRRRSPACRLRESAERGARSIPRWGIAGTTRPSTVAKAAGESSRSASTCVRITIGATQRATSGTFLEGAIGRSRLSSDASITPMRRAEGRISRRNSSCFGPSFHCHRRNARHVAAGASQTRSQSPRTGSPVTRDDRDGAACRLHCLRRQPAVGQHDVDASRTMPAPRPQAARSLSRKKFERDLAPFLVAERAQLSAECREHGARLARPRRQDRDPHDSSRGLLREYAGGTTIRPAAVRRNARRPIAESPDVVRKSGHTTPPEAFTALAAERDQVGVHRTICPLD